MIDAYDLDCCSLKPIGNDVGRAGNDVAGTPAGADDTRIVWLAIARCSVKCLIRTRDRALLVGDDLDQARIDCNAIATNRPFLTESASRKRVMNLAKKKPRDSRIAGCSDHENDPPVPLLRACPTDSGAVATMALEKAS